MWGLIATMALPLVLSLLFIYVMIFGPSEFHRDGLVGKLHYHLVITLPGVMGTMATKIFGQSCVRRGKSCVNYVINESNPLLQIFYLFLVTGGCLIFLLQGYARCLEGTRTWGGHAVVAPLLMLLTYYWFYVACKSDPGRIRNVLMAKKAQEIYPYDGVIFKRKDCKSCKWPKPARSKHCGLCNACVARYDHHCAWINNCVGANNTRYFWRFLFMTSVLCFYLSYVIVNIFYNTAMEGNLYSRSFRDPATGMRTQVNHFHVAMFFLHTDLPLCMLLLFATLCGLILLLFLLYHVYLVAVGTTTSETFKWDDIKYQLKHGEEIVVEQAPDEEDSDRPQPQPQQHQGDGQSKLTKKAKGQPKVTPEGPKKPAKKVIKHAKELTNIYHRGAWNNIQEILFPPRLL